MSKSTKGLSPWITVGILVFSAMISTFNETILNVGFLAISEEFSITVNTAQWLVTGYMLVTSVMVPISAFLYTKYNTRTLFIFAMSVLLITDIGCFFAVNFPMLFAMRLVQAVGNGLIIPIMMNTALIVAPRDKIGTAMALCASGVTVGPGFGPVVSGVLMDFFNWRAIFVLMAVLIAAALVLGLAFVGNYSQEKKTKINVPSVVLCTVGLSLFLYGINSLTSSTASSLCFIAVGVIVLGIFVFLQGRVENPMLDFTPLKLKYFRRNTYIVSFSMFLNFMLSTLTPSYLQGAFGVGTMLSALLLLPGVLSNAVITAISGRILDKHGTRV
nr:MFS transporter [Eubacterium sp.]